MHIRNLELYLDLGIKLSRIDSVLQFNESTWLEKHIVFNTTMRSNAKHNFENDYYKLLNNSAFGKTMENLRKRVNIKLTGSEDIFTKHAAKASCLSGLTKTYLKLIE